MKTYTLTELKLRDYLFVSEDDVIHNTHKVCVALSEGTINYERAVDILRDNLKVPSHIVGALITLFQQAQGE